MPYSLEKKYSDPSFQAVNIHVIVTYLRSYTVLKRHSYFYLFFIISSPLLFRSNFFLNLSSDLYLTQLSFTIIYLMFIPSSLYRFTILSLHSYVEHFMEKIVIYSFICSSFLSLFTYLFGWNFNQ